MKFSWNLTNSFIKSNRNSIREIEEKLILSGIEIDSIERLNGDIILDLSITTNRKEIDSSFSLAREISTLTDNKIYTKPIKLSQKNLYTIGNLNKEIRYVRIHEFEDSGEIQEIKWINRVLKIQNIDLHKNLYDIKEYIKMKWGQTFNIIEIEQIDHVKETIKEQDLTEYSNCINSIARKVTPNSNKKLLIFATTQNLNLNRTRYKNDMENFYENYYIDALKIICTATNNTIGKYHESYEIISSSKKIIEVRRNKINQTLGSTKRKKLQFIKTKDIISALDKIKLSPIYMKKRRSFLVEIPKYRSHDLIRDIDIVEEIGKIYEFRNFYDKNYKNVIKGHQTKEFILINNIRQVIRNLGLNEIVTCSIRKNKQSYMNGLQIFNPINQKQNKLRTSIVENLIENYEYNLKYCNEDISIFEIGKVFNKNEQNLFDKEARYLSGLISNDSYIKKDWLDQPGAFNIFHMKGIIELLSEKIKAKVFFKSIKNHYNINQTIKKNSIVGIYNKNTGNVIGIIGEVKSNILSNNQNKEKRVYIFEINLNQLFRSITHEGHLKYTKKIYSKYPSITRDISIKIKEQTCIQNIYEQVLGINKEITESIEVLNEYVEKNRENSTKNRFIAIRVTYRSHGRTLNISDINNIDNKLNVLKDKFNKFA